MERTYAENVDSVASSTLVFVEWMCTSSAETSSAREAEEAASIRQF
jgi:hypothetical protein